MMKQTDMFSQAPGGPSDQRQRALAITTFDRPIMLEAGAGTGKTATLVARIVCWCMGTGWEAAGAESAAKRGDVEEHAARVLGRVLAITFTEAAAAEMSARVAQALGGLQRASSPDGSEEEEIDEEQLPAGLLRAHLPASRSIIHERAHALRGSLDYLGISTIHAFCKRLMVTHPLELGLPPQFEVDADNTLQAEVSREVLESYLAESLGDPDLLELTRRKLSPAKIEEALMSLLENGARAEHLEGDPFDEKTCRALLQELGGPLEQLQGLIAAHLPGMPQGQKIHKAVSALAETSLALAGTTEEETQTARESLELVLDSIRKSWPQGAYEKIDEWNKTGPNVGERKKLGERVEEFSAVARSFQKAFAPLKKLDPSFLNCARRVLHTLIERVPVEMQRRGMVTFGDLLEKAHSLLSSDENIARREQRRIGLFLVDEFQDTDQRQCELVEMLALTGSEEERPALFLVGDPKQSIFSWRSADLGAYDRFKAKVLEGGGELLQLNCNFRSTPAVLAEVQRLIEGVMEEEVGVQPPFVPLEAFRSDREGSAPSIEHWTSWPANPDTNAIESKSSKTKITSYSAEANAIAHDIFEQHKESGCSWNDVAIIFRALTTTDPYLEELRRRGIPFEVQNDRSYYKRREIIDAGALVRAVLDPGDQIATVALLRSPMVGVPDAALLPLWQGDFPDLVARLGASSEDTLPELEELLVRTAQGLPASIPGIEGIRGWEASAIRALHALASARRTFEEDTADRWITRLRELFLPDVTESARYLGFWRLGNLERFFQLLLENLERHRGDVPRVLRELRAKAGSQEKVAAGQPRDSDADAVHILTIHGAKGLEFSQVYLPQMHKDDARQGGGAPTQFNAREELISYQLFGSPSPTRFATEELRLRTERAERVRLFYVALTRARDRLVLLGSWREQPKKAAWVDASNFMDLMEWRDGADSAVNVLVDRALESNDDPHLDASDVAWRLAAMIGPALEPERIEREAFALPSAAEGARIFGPLRERREDARAHALRPYHARASDGARAPAARTSQTAGELQPGDRSSARSVGTTVHRLLEELDLSSNLATEVAQLRQDLGAALGTDEKRLFDELLDRMLENGILERLAALQPHIIARELTTLAPPAADTSDAVGFVSGALDLLYRDPETEELVIADYKTDRIALSEELEQHAAGYRSQGRRYVEALRAALELEQPPRFELWFLGEGRVVPVPS